MNALLWAPVTAVIGLLIANREREEMEKQLAKSEAQEAQTRLLQSQLHPHVLFNSLNGLLELVHKDPNAAETCIRNMSDLLRKLLQASEQSFFRLDQERQLVGHYLAMEGLRLGNRLTVVWEWAEGIDDLLVPPLMLQPLVENALKHGIAPHVEGGQVRIRAWVDGRLLHLEVWNTGEAPLPSPRSGTVGVKNLKSRLKLAFGAKAHYTLVREGVWTKAVVILPIQRGEVL